MPTGIWHALRASCRESSQPFSMTVLPLRASIFVPARSACLTSTPTYQVSGSREHGDLWIALDS
jgi:hypothetical protein